MVLCFALCASFAFAQTNNVASSNQVAQNRQASKQSLSETQQAGYKASIFSKAEGDTIESFDFSNTSTYTVGTLSANDVINGTQVGPSAAHNQTYPSSMWMRLTDTSIAYLQSMVSTIPVWADNTDGNGVWHPFPFRSNSPTNGYMLMSMEDQIPDWGGTGTNGAFNSYIALNAVDASNAPLIDIRLYQYYRCFNSDKCWIDYSTDNGTTWSAVEFNVRGVDCETNNSYRNWKRVTLPTVTAHQANLKLRIRWSCNSKVGGAYGYFWAVDDVYVIEGPANRLTTTKAEYFEGFYQMMPQGLEVPMVWDAFVENTGGNAQQNVQGSLWTSPDLNTAFTKVAESDLVPSLAAMEDTVVFIDPKGYRQTSGWGYMLNTDTVNKPFGDTASLPTSTLGQHFVYADISSNTYSHAYATTDGGWMTYDTIGYNVNAIDPATNTAVWGRDNGVLSKFSYYCYGVVREEGDSRIVSDDPEDPDVMWHNQGYSMYNTYLTGDNVPAGWRIKGVEIVGSTYPGYCEDGSYLAADLIWDSCLADGENMTAYRNSINTGANPYRIQSSDITTGQDLAELEYETYGNYNTIRINFPEQPELQPSTSYRIGYQLVEDCYFLPATGTNYFYDLTDTSEIYFRDMPSMKGYGELPGHPAYYSTAIIDPRIQTWIYPGEQYASYPMIRMLVGPYEYLPHTTVTFECPADESGAIYSMNYDELCGRTDSVVCNSTQSYNFIPSDETDTVDGVVMGWVLDQILVNGVATFTNSTDPEEMYVGTVREDFTIGLEPETISCTFRKAELPQDESIDPVFANVEMTLQPNPASTSVKLTVSGVEGMVNCTLIDMSGRVISTSKFDAANAQTIDLNGLAKGAYFVRLTNSNLCKVAKLIVR